MPESPLTRLASASEGVPAYNEPSGGGGDPNELPPAALSAAASVDEEAGPPSAPRGVVVQQSPQRSAAASSNERLATANSNFAVDFPQTRNDLPKIDALNVKCEKNHMTVSSERATNENVFVRMNE